MLDDWKVKVAIQDAITTNIKVYQYAEKYLFRKNLSVEAGKYKQSSLERLEQTYNTHLRDTEAVKKSFTNLTAEDIAYTINSKKETLKKICQRAELPPYTLHALRHYVELYIYVIM